MPFGKDSSIHSSCWVELHEVGNLLNLGSTTSAKFLMPLVAHHGLDITQIVLRILTALQAIPNHRIYVLKSVDLMHFFLRQCLHFALL